MHIGLVNSHYVLVRKSEQLVNVIQKYFQLIYLLYLHVYDSKQKISTILLYLLFFYYNIHIWLVSL